MDYMKDGFVKDLLLEGRYKTISPLNHGSFGMVFLAKDLTKNELVAIKCLAKQSIASPCPEANTTDHLLELLCHDRLGHHPNVVNLLHAFETETHMFLVLEYCAMGDLYEAIRLGRGPLQTDHVRSFMQQLIGSVEFMHAKGLYHRDIKPENIFLSSDGSMKLGDFGLSTTESWTTEASVGSDRYMAPEQYDPGETGYSPAQADVWAIGICLLNILFSRNPFVTPSESDVLFADFVRDRQSLFDVFPALSQDAFELLTHSLSIDPAKRSLTAMREALDRIVSFTTDEEVSDDDFCTETPGIYGKTKVPIATTASRAPLRTPSIQSPPVEQGGAFPWAKALHLTSPVQTSVRQLSAIPEPESHSEAQASSFASGIDSALGASIQSLQLREPKPRSHLAPVSAASTTLVPVPVPQAPKTAAAVLYATDNVSKSWSDLWDEEAEESEAEAEDARRAYNNLNWSSDAVNEDVTIKRSGLAEITNPSVTNARAQKQSTPVVGSKPSPIAVTASASTSDVSSLGTASPRSPAYSPPAKRSVLDKWAALGNRRRAVNGDADNNSARSASTNDSTKQKSTGNYFGGSTWRKGFGLKAFGGNVGFKRGVDSNNNSSNSVYGHFGGVGNGSNGRISSSSLTNLPATPGRVGLGLGLKSAGSRRGNGNGNGQGVSATPTGRVKASRRMNNKDGHDTDGGVRARDWRRHQDDDTPSKRVSVAASRDDVEWVGGWKDLQL